MKEADVVFKTKSALTFMARGGLRASLFVDTVEEDADMMLDMMLNIIPKSQRNVVIRAITEWRRDHAWLEHMPDKLETPA